MGNYFNLVYMKFYCKIDKIILTQFPARHRLLVLLSEEAKHQGRQTPTGLHPRVRNHENFGTDFDVRRTQDSARARRRHFGLGRVDRVGPIRVRFGHRQHGIGGRLHQRLLRCSVRADGGNRLSRTARSSETWIRYQVKLKNVGV